MTSKNDGQRFVARSALRSEDGLDLGGGVEVLAIRAFLRKESGTAR